jgi:PAS domain-containing protein
MGAGISGGHAKPRAAEPALADPVRDSSLRLRRYGSGRELDRGVLSDALRSAPNAVLIVDSFDRICFASELAAQLLGRSSEALRQSFLNDWVAAGESDAQLATTAVARTALGPCTLPVTLADGRMALMKMNGLRDHWGDVAHVSIVLEVQAASSASAEAALDSLGRLAGELAHDVNNQLSAALNYVFILRRRLASIEPIASHLEELQAAVWRASGLASTLRVVGRKRNSEPESLLLDDVVRGLQPLLRHVARDVHVEIVHAAEAYALNAPRAYVEQAIMIVALLLLARAPTDSALRVSTIHAHRTDHSMSSARIVLELVGDREPAPARSNSNGHSTHHGLRRALKRCRARMGHDARTVWIEFS